MLRVLSFSFALLLAGGAAALAGPAGYLRQGPPQPLRFARALIPPPPVNELILALGKPVPGEESGATNELSAPMADADLPDHLKSAIEDLISKPAASPAATVVDTAQAPAAETATSSLPLPEVVPPVAPPPEVASQLGELLLLFKNNRRDSGRGDAAVVVAPPTFLPPQSMTPAPSSRAVYRSQ